MTPLGMGADALLEQWAGGHSAIVDGQARCRDFDPTEFLTRRELRNADRFTQLAIAASDAAVDQANWRECSPCQPDRVGCIIGTGMGGMHTVENECLRLLEEGPSRVSPLGVTRQMPNAPAATLSLRHGWTGESYGLVSACAAGAQAIGAGCLMIRAGIVDAAVVGGADAFFTDLFSAFFDVMGGTSRSGIARPFDKRHDGFVPGEGAGILVLEAVEAAVAREATILGYIIGYGSSTDAYHLSVPRPDGGGACQAMSRALADARIDPKQVAYINAHGTSTRRNDEIEALAIRKVFGEHRVKVSSLKSATGHLQGAAGAVEAIATLYALRAGIAPPTLGLEKPDASCALDHVLYKPVRLDGAQETGLIGLSNSFGLGGHNATLAIRAS